MKVEKVLGHIDCPTCGTVGGMRITHDKNGHPFGYCEAECSQQLRIGGDVRRVRKFLARFPWAAGQQEQPPATPPSGAAPVTGTDTPPAKKKSSNPFEFLLGATA